MVTPQAAALLQDRVGSDGFMWRTRGNLLQPPTPYLWGKRVPLMTHGSELICGPWAYKRRHLFIYLAHITPAYGKENLSLS